MNKYFIITALILSSLAFYQNASAHNEVDKYEDSEAKRQTKDEQDAKDSWDDFMKAVDEQDTKKAQKTSDGHHQKDNSTTMD